MDNIKILLYQTSGDVKLYQVYVLVVGVCVTCGHIGIFVFMQFIQFSISIVVLYNPTMWMCNNI